MDDDHPFETFDERAQRRSEEARREHEEAWARMNEEQFDQLEQAMADGTQMSVTLRHGMEKFVAQAFPWKVLGISVRVTALAGLALYALTKGSKQ